MSLASRKVPSVPLWVCIDCIMLHANGDISEDADRPPLGLLDDVELTMGLLMSEHADDCPNRIADDYIEECECETREFGTNTCPGCGSTLAGTRHAITAWLEPEQA